MSFYKMLYIVLSFIVGVWITIKKRWNRPYIISYETRQGKRLLTWKLNDEVYTIVWPVRKRPNVDVTARGVRDVTPEDSLKPGPWLTHRKEGDKFTESVELRKILGPDQNFFGRTVTPKQLGYDEIELNFYAPDDEDCNRVRTEKILSDEAILI